MNYLHNSNSVVSDTFLNFVVRSMMRISLQGTVLPDSLWATLVHLFGNQQLDPAVRKMKTVVLCKDVFVGPWYFGPTADSKLASLHSQQAVMREQCANPDLWLELDRKYRDMDEPLEQL